jgi:Protein of unknown function (DUF2586)
MSLPSVTVQKLNANSGTVPLSATGVAALIAPCQGGSSTTNVATPFNSPLAAQQQYLAGPLVEEANYEMNVTGLPVVLVKPTTATAAVYGPLNKVIAGTAVPTLGSAALVADDYNQLFNGGEGTTMAGPLPQALAGQVAGVLVYFTAASTLGTSGALVYSLDGGNTCTPVQAIGTATTLSPVEPGTQADTGIRITLGSSGQTYQPGDYFWFVTVGPRMQSGDLINALQGLYISKQPWDILHVHGETASGLVATLEAWVLTMNATGRFPTVVVNTRFKQQTPGSAETEITYAAAIATILNPCVGNDVCAGVDGGAVNSSLTGVTKAFPTSLAILAKCEANDVGVDPAEVDLGPVPGYDIDNAALTPSFHDEAVTNNIDYVGSTVRGSTLRSFFGQDGAYITNAYLLSSPGSDYVYIQNNRTMNACATIAFAMLTQLLSKGVPRNLKTSTILEPVAAGWENLILKRMEAAVDGQVSGIAFSISRTDVFTGNGPQTVNATLSNDSLAYVKKFALVAQFVSTLGT